MHKLLMLFQRWLKLLKLNLGLYHLLPKEYPKQKITEIQAVLGARNALNSCRGSWQDAFLTDVPFYLVTEESN